MQRQKLTTLMTFVVDFLDSSGSIARLSNYDNGSKGVSFKDAAERKKISGPNVTAMKNQINHETPTGGKSEDVVEPFWDDLMINRFPRPSGAFEDCFETRGENT